MLIVYEFIKYILFWKWSRYLNVTLTKAYAQQSSIFQVAFYRMTSWKKMLLKTIKNMVFVQVDSEHTGLKK